MSEDDTVLRLHEEQLSVTSERVVSGRVRISTKTHEHEALVDELLASEHVEIHRQPVDRHVSIMPEVRTEGDVIIVPVVEEKLFVERRLVLKEEIHVRRVRETERFQDRVVLRSQEAVIDREPPGEPLRKESEGR
jgi:uncharacterized protein (TIGR02271 family)